MHQILYDKIKEFITIYSSGSVNINTASNEVLISLGIDERVVEKIVEFRVGDDGVGRGENPITLTRRLTH